MGEDFIVNFHYDDNLLYSTVDLESLKMGMKEFSNSCFGDHIQNRTVQYNLGNSAMRYRHEIGAELDKLIYLDPR